MAVASKGRVRFSGTVLIICAVVLLIIGTYLLYFGLNWIMPDIVPAEWRRVPQGVALPLDAAMQSPVGLAGLFVAVFGAVAGLNGLWMAGFGTRNWVLTMPLVLLFLIFIGVGAWATLDGDGFSRWLETLHP